MRRVAALAVLFGAGVLVSRQAAWAQGSTLLSINCGDNSYTPAGWVDDDPYVTGGMDYTFGVAPDTAGVANAAPAAVYQTVRHRGSDAGFTLSVPTVPDGQYIVRFHFYDEYNSGNRAMDITVEGVLVLDDFNIFAEAGDRGALVKDFPVTVSDGNGLQVVGDRDAGDDVFYTGIEIILAEPPELDSVTVTPDIAYVRPNEAVELTATSLDQYGNPFAATIDWVLDGGGSLSSATGDTTTFASDGTEGTFTVTASSGTFIDTASVYVAAPELTTITITPSSANIPLTGGSVELTAEALDQYGDPVAAAITWTVDPTGGPGVTPATGTTDPVTGQRTTTFDSDGSTEDTFTVTATSGAVSGAATVTVTDLPFLASLTLSAPTYIVDNQGAPLTWTVLAKDQFGDSIPLVDVDFSIDPVGGTFDPTPATTDANGIATTFFTPDGTSSGDFTVTASSGGVEATKTLTITDPPVLTSIEVTPATAAIATGGSVTLTAQPLDQFGAAFTATVDWTVDTSGGAVNPTTGDTTTFTSNGTVGEFTVTATSGSVTGTASVTVALPLPGDFMLLAPDGTTEVDPAEAVVFEWSASSEATSYHFQLARNEAFTDLVLNQPDLTATTVTLLGGPLRLGKTYRWRVTARNGSGTTAASNAPVVFETTPPAGDYNLMGCGPDVDAGGSPGREACAAVACLAILVILIPAALLLAAGGRRRRRLSHP